MAWPPRTASDLLEIYAGLSYLLPTAAKGGAADAAATLTGLAVTAVPGAEQASISDRGGDSTPFGTLAATGPMARRGDELQYELGSGPCVDVLQHDFAYRTSDISTDTRWPVFGQLAHAQAGVNSMLSLRLYFERAPRRVTWLNLYASGRGAFTDTSETVATILATHSALILATISAQHQITGLEAALTSNRRIGIAIGILMATYKTTDNDAFTLLSLASQRTNRKVRDLAEDVIQTGTLELSR